MAAPTGRCGDDGPVRAPLTDPGPDDLADLEALLTTGLDLVGAAQ
ncbi:hypothetical protein [Streptomyces sp. NPDC021212]